MLLVPLIQYVPFGVLLLVVPPVPMPPPLLIINTYLLALKAQLRGHLLQEAVHNCLLLAHAGACLRLRD